MATGEKIITATAEDLRSFFLAAVTAVTSTNGGGRTLGFDGIRYMADVFLEATGGDGTIGPGDEKGETRPQVELPDATTGDLPSIPSLKKAADGDLFRRAYFRTTDAIAGRDDLGLRATAMTYRLLGGISAGPTGLIMGWLPAVYISLADNLKSATSTMARVADLTRLMAGDVGAVADIEETQNIYEFMLATAPREVREKVLLGRTAIYLNTGPLRGQGPKSHLS